MPLQFSVDGDISSYGNHFIVGLSGTTLDSGDKALLKALKPAGLLLLARNIDQTAPYHIWRDKLAKLIAEVKQITEREELLISIDHEGGHVTRLPAPITPFPYASQFVSRAADVARAQASELRSLGINLSWAPVADVHSNPANPVIGKRAFGTSPAAVSAAAVSYLKALQAEGILGCAKHFPGHGDTSTDSHHELPTVNLSEQELFARELVPFEALIKADVPFMMTAHIVYPQIDPGTPATLSKKILTDILRNRLNFKRVVVSDDLDMKAVSKSFDSPQTMARAFNAGCDMFIVARNDLVDGERTLRCAQAIVDGLANHGISEETLFASFTRINAIFEDLLTMNAPHELTSAALTNHAQLAKAFA